MVNDDNLLLRTVLEISTCSDIYEEPAMDFIEDHNIPIYSHSRAHIVSTAFEKGWRPEGLK